MRKSVSIILTAILLCIAITGCGKASSTATQETTESVTESTTETTVETITEETTEATVSDDEYFNPDEFYIDNDLNNIGFNDMMGYYDWCEVYAINYKDGEGYVDLNANRIQYKYSFQNGYCMCYTFNRSTGKRSFVYKESYDRILKCNIVDNDSIILIPQDTGNYINLQILDRTVFHSDEYVYMTINNGYYKLPVIPYEFVDWDNYEKTMDENKDPIYRYKLKLD